MVAKISEWITAVKSHFVASFFSPAILAWGHAVGFSEDSVEASPVAETASSRDLGDREVRCRAEKPLRLRQASFAKLGYERPA